MAAVDVTAMFNELLEQHRPITVAHPDGSGLVQVHCLPCDGSRWKLWRPGDPPVVCFFWQQAIDAGVVIPEP